MYVSNYMFNKKLSPTVLCASKFDVSWGWWSKISKLPKVGDFSLLSLKVRFWNTRTWCNFRNHTSTPNECGSKARRSPYKLLSEFGVLRRIYTTRREVPSLRMDGWMGWLGWDGTEYIKCPSMLFILCGYIENVYIYLYLKIVPNILMGFNIWWQVGGSGPKFQNYHM